MVDVLLATDKETGARVNLLQSFNKSDKTLKEFMNFYRRQFNRFDIQFQPLCLACPFDTIVITYYYGD